MALNEEWLDKAQDAFDHSSSNREGIAAAIETYIAEMFRPGTVMTSEPLEAIPQRDYRKELWIGVATAVSGCDVTTELEAPGHWANHTLAEFDKIFPKETPNG